MAADGNTMTTGASTVRRESRAAMTPASVPASVRERMRASVRAIVHVDAGFLLYVVIVAVLAGSAVALVYSVFMARELTHELQMVRAERNQLDVEWTQLLLERNTWGAYNTIGKVAVDSLGMKVPQVNEVEMIRL